MADTLPVAVNSLARSLENNLGFSKVEDSTSESFGNRVIAFKLGQYQIRALRDRGIWSVEFSESKEPNKWYYTALLRDAVDGASGKDLSIEEKVKFWETRWSDVRAFFERDAAAAHRELDRLALEISKRRNPSWYQ